MMLWVYPPKVEKPPEPKRLSEAQKAEIKSIFVLYDLNDNGLLDKKELLEALADTGYDDDEIEALDDPAPEDRAAMDSGDDDDGDDDDMDEDDD